MFLLTEAIVILALFWLATVKSDLHHFKALMLKTYRIQYDSLKKLLASELSYKSVLTS
jgi:hypothetical protein